MHARNRTIIEIAHLLGRSPSSIAMKLVNFAALDPEQRARGIRGLAGYSRADAKIWSEFQDNWEQMTLLSEKKLSDLRVGQVGKSESEIDSSDLEDVSITEVERLITIRTMQGVFRKMVLAAYDRRCCITGMPIKEILVASHILPWAEFPAERLNPRNGLCLAAISIELLIVV